MGWFSRIFFWRRSLQEIQTQNIVRLTSLFMTAATMHITEEDLAESETSLQCSAFMLGAVTYLCMSVGFTVDEGSRCFDLLAIEIFGERQCFRKDLLIIVRDIESGGDLWKYQKAGASAMRDWYVKQDSMAPFVYLYDLRNATPPVEPRQSREVNRGTV